MPSSSQVVRALLLFGAGALLSWWLTAVAPSPPRADVPRAAADGVPLSSMTGRAAAAGTGARELVAGLPPDEATKPKSAPDGGRGRALGGRALSRALDRLETDPPATASAAVDEDTTARVTDSLRARLIERGAPR